MEQWLNQLTLGERRTILIGTVTLVGILIYFMVWEPFVTARTQLEQIVASEKATLRWMNQAAAQVQQLRNQSQTASAPINKQSLLSLIDQSTRTGALSKANKRIQPTGDKQVRVDLNEISFTELMKWLEQLYNQHQIQVSTIRIERLPISDRVKVRLTLDSKL
jgi:general secretion pathway protein M